jgi:hypothetical protein
VLVIAALCAAPTLAFAQATPAPAAPAADAPAPPAEAPPAAPLPQAIPPADMAPADGAEPVPTLSDVSAKLNGLEESYGATKAIVDTLAKIKISGYIQARLGLHENSAAGVDQYAVTRPTIYDRFYVRRARLKVVYAGTNAEYLFQIDATGAGTVLKDAEASFIDTWTPFNFKLTGGQFKVPFGYEVLQSSGDREMPERARFIRVFFPNERDRGLRLQATRDWFRFSGAVVNGNFIQDGTANGVYANTDPNGWKDVIGRVGGDFDWLVFGVSGSYGKTMATTLGSGANPVSYMAWKRLRLGADVQMYFDIPSVGGLAIKGEAAMQKDDNVAATAVANPCNDVLALGWYGTAVQNIGDYFGVVFRVDQYFWNLASRAGCPATTMPNPNAQNPWQVPTDSVTTTYGGGLLVYGSANIKFSVIGEKVTGKRQLATVPMSSPAAYYALPGGDDDRITFQLQAKF